MSLEHLIARTLAVALYRKFPKLDPQTLFKAKKAGGLLTFESENDQGTKVGFFEDDGRTGYFYIIDAKTRDTEAACWLYNRIPAPPLAEAVQYAARNEAPPLPSDFKHDAEAPPRNDLSLDTIEVGWNRSGTATVVRYKGCTLGMLAWDEIAWKSYPWLLNEPCKWGEPLTQEIADRYINHELSDADLVWI
jgi:hypothetical protein